MSGLDNEGDERAAEFLPREAGEGDRVAVEGARLARRSVEEPLIARTRAPSTAFGGPPPPLRGGGVAGVEFVGDGLHLLRYRRGLCAAP